MREVIFVDTPPKIEIRNGMAYITDVSGDSTHHRCMSIHALRVGHEITKRVLAEWDAEQRGNVARFPKRDCG